MAESYRKFRYHQGYIFGYVKSWFKPVSWTISPRSQSALSFENNSTSIGRKGDHIAMHGTEECAEYPDASAYV